MSTLAQYSVEITRTNLRYTFAYNPCMGEMMRANVYEEERRIKDRFALTLAISASIIAAVRLARDDIAAFHGRARFAGPMTVRVGEVTLEGRYVVIAAGDARCRQRHQSVEARSHCQNRT
jgi:hypothetical protein